MKRGTIPAQKLVRVCKLDGTDLFLARITVRRWNNCIPLHFYVLKSFGCVFLARRVAEDNQINLHPTGLVLRGLTEPVARR
jgi:hypothetical protein